MVVGFKFFKEIINKRVTWQSAQRLSAVMTLGPASWNSPVLEPVIRNRHMGVARINYSHATEASEYVFLRTRIELVSELSHKHGAGVLCFADAPGWKIRLSRNFDKVPVKKGSLVNLSDEIQPGCLTCNHPPYLDLGAVGKRVYIGDRTPTLRIIAKRGSMLECQVESEGDEQYIYPGKGITIESARVSTLNLDPLTAADIAALVAGIAAGADYLGMSYGTTAAQFRIFIQKAKDLGAKPGTKFVFKFELGDAFEDLEEIVRLADVIYFGQGDLGLSVSYKELERLRGLVINECIRQGKECWVGTGLLSSLVKSKVPSPGEFAGVVAVRKAGASRLVLSDEFTVGEYPENAAEVLHEGVSIADAEFTQAA